MKMGQKTVWVSSHTLSQPCQQKIWSLHCHQLCHVAGLFGNEPHRGANTGNLCKTKQSLNRGRPWDSDAYRQFVAVAADYAFPVQHSFCIKTELCFHV